MEPVFLDFALIDTWCPLSLSSTVENRNFLILDLGSEIWVKL